MTADHWIRLVELAVWPVVVLTLGLVLRRPISTFLASVAGRVSKVSVMSVSVELAVAEPAAPPWRGWEDEDVRGLVVADHVNDSYFDTLREALRASGTADYFLVDLHRDGEEWLTSRLYVFSYLLARLKGVRAVVFVATRDDVAGTFLGVAPVDGVMRALTTAEPWLCRARQEAENQLRGLPPLPAAVPPDPASIAAAPSVPDLEDWWAEIRSGASSADPLQVASSFLGLVQWQQQPGAPDPGAGWLRLPDTPGQPATWELATWLRSADLTDGLLRGVVEPDWCVVDDRSWTEEQRVSAVAVAPGDFVALLTPSRRFDRLIDRRAVLMALGEARADGPYAG